MELNVLEMVKAVPETGSRRLGHVAKKRTSPFFRMSKLNGGEI
jgi:hypothetical protein